MLNLLHLVVCVSSCADCSVCEVFCNDGLKLDLLFVTFVALNISTNILKNKKKNDIKGTKRSKLFILLEITEKVN